MSRANSAPPRRILRLPEVKSLTGFGRSSIYEFMRNGDFPRCRRIGPRAVGWDSHEVEAWVNSKLGGHNQ